MTFSEAEDLAIKNIDSLRATQFFTLGGQHCMFLGLIVSPSNSTIEFKQLMYDECIEKGITDYRILSERGLINEDMNVFLIYKQGGTNIIIPLETYFNASNNAG